MIMLFEVENKAPLEVSEFRRIETGLRSLKTYGPSSFASLTREDGSYLQVAGGRVTCVLERRTMPDLRHFRAYLEKPKVPFEGPQILMFGGGQIKMQPNEILFIDDVVLAFRAFFENQIYPPYIFWRDMTSDLHSKN